MKNIIYNTIHSLPFGGGLGRGAIFLLLALLLSSCRTTKHTIVETTDTTDIERLEHKVTEQSNVIDSLLKVIFLQDSIVHMSEAKDSTYSRLWQTENLTVQDSIYEKEFADGSRLREIWHKELHTIALHDTLYKYKENKELKEQLRLQQELTDHTLMAYTDMRDSLIHLRDSINNASHVEQKVVEKRPWWKDVLTSLVVLALVTLFGYFLCRGDINKMANKSH